MQDIKDMHTTVDGLRESVALARKESLDLIIARIKELTEQNTKLVELVRYIEFSAGFRCEVHNGKECDSNTQEAYETALKSIRREISKVLEELGINT